MRLAILLILLLFSREIAFAGKAQPYLERGWKALVIDNDIEALRYFGLAYETAQKENNTGEIALSLLNLGICYYSVSYTEGLEYSFKALAEYKKLENSAPEKAFQGRSKCLQLISTIKSRQGKYREAISLSKEAMLGFAKKNDTTGYLGLIYYSLGVAYSNLQLSDSSEYFHHKALEERIQTRNYVYLPVSYLSVAEIELKKGNKKQSFNYYQQAYHIADSTGNRQSQVTSLLGLGKWYLTFEKDQKKTEDFYLKAKLIADHLTDKSFYLKCLNELIELAKIKGDFRSALNFEQEKVVISDTLYSWDKQKAIKSLEIQFSVAEKDRQLNLMQKEKAITILHNYILWGTLGFLLLMSCGIIVFLRRINRRDHQLLITKEDLVKALEAQKELKEKQLHNELEFKENKLNAMTFQMLQKNELLTELKEKLDQDIHLEKDSSINKIITKGLNHDKEWKDFNTYFESINKNFYERIKQAYPEISPNDLKICALIKLNLSIKEMAGILNISPDSVKTARYRLRKKLQMNTEDNLTDFILNL